MLANLFLLEILLLKSSKNNMPFKSQAQRAKFYSDPKLKRYIPEFERATGKKKLPKTIKKTKKNVK